MAPQGSNSGGRHNGKAAPADSPSADEIQLSLTRAILGQDPVIGRCKRSAPGAPSEQELPADEPGSEAAQPPNPIPTNDSDGDQQSGPSPSDVTSSQAESSGESSSACIKSKHNACKGACLKDSKCLKHTECLKESSNAAGGDQESTTSASAESQPETSDASVEMSDKSSDRRRARQSATKHKAKAGHKSETTTESSSVASAADSSAPSSSGADSGNEPESSEKNDDASTAASTPGAESSKEAFSDDGESKKASAEGAARAGGSAWSVSEDHLLRGMKESQDNLSWADIGKAINRHKNDVKARWKAIKDNHGQPMPDDKTSGEEKESPPREPGGQAESSKASGVSEHTSNEIGHHVKTSRESQGAAEADTPSDTKGKGKAKADASTRKRQRNDKVAMENKSARSRAAESSQRDCDILSGEEASSESSLVVDEDDEDDDYDGFDYGWQQQKRHDIRYLQNEVYRELYPNMIQPEPDEFFGEHDCAVLAAVDSKYKRSKWLEMQANFYNVTGRLVPLHLIRDRCERAEQQGALRRHESQINKAAAADDGARRQHVESWVDGVQQESLGDPDI